MKQILLTQNKFALVDDDVFEHLNQFKWHARKRVNTFYAYRSIRLENKCTQISIHRQILKLSYKDGKQIDHIDRNGLNNQRLNLRICTNQQNHFNQRPRKNTSSKLKGVSWYKRGGKWQAKIGYNGKQIHLGFFLNEIDAAKAYDRAAQKYFREFSRLNFKEVEK